VAVIHALLPGSDSFCLGYQVEPLLSFLYFPFFTFLSLLHSKIHVFDLLLFFPGSEQPALSSRVAEQCAQGVELLFGSIKVANPLVISKVLLTPPVIMDLLGRLYSPVICPRAYSSVAYTDPPTHPRT
jgi:hypothetical protein